MVFAPPVKGSARSINQMRSCFHPACNLPLDTYSRRVTPLAIQNLPGSYPACIA